jgi:hypothetical protein
VILKYWQQLAFVKYALLVLSMPLLNKVLVNLALGVAFVPKLD